MTAYFQRMTGTSFRATSHVGGAWNTDEQHIAPALGLLTHLVELDRDTRGRTDLLIGRLSFDILGVLPIGVVDTSVRVLRPGRTVELVEATLASNGRVAVLLRAWLMRAGDTAALAGSAATPLTPPDDMPPWDPTTVWPGGFVASVEVRRHQTEPGRASFWVRTPLQLIDDEATSRLARTAGLLDIANGITVRADPADVAFPNLDLTAHFVARPRSDWTGFDTTVSFGPDGRGLTSSVLHDTAGPVGAMAQTLTIRAR